MKFEITTAHRGDSNSDIFSQDFGPEMNARVAKSFSSGISRERRNALISFLASLSLETLAVVLIGSGFITAGASIALASAILFGFGWANDAKVRRAAAVTKHFQSKS